MMSIAEQYSRAAQTETDARRNAERCKSALVELVEELNAILADDRSTESKFSVITEPDFPKSTDKTVSIGIAEKSGLQRVLTVAPNWTNKYLVEAGSFFKERSKSDHVHNQKIRNMEELLRPSAHRTVEELSKLAERALMITLSNDERDTVISRLADNIEGIRAAKFAAQEEAIAVAGAQLATQDM